MRKTLFFISIILISSCGIFKPKWPSGSFINRNNYEEVISESDIEKHSDVFSGKLDQSPMYPNGLNGILKHIAENFNYPTAAKQKEIKGKVYVSLSISSEGWVENVEVVKSSNEIFNDEAIRVVKAMERWIPAKLNREFVDFRYVLPINLKSN